MSITLIDLPHEVILIIIRQLKKKDHFQLRKICHRLNKIIEPFIFHTVTIKSGSIFLNDLENSLSSITDMNNKYSSDFQPIGVYIQQLSLLDDMTTIDELTRLPHLCPNIKKLCLSYTILENINDQELPASTIDIENNPMSLFYNNNNNNNNNVDNDSDSGFYEIHSSIHQFMKSIAQPHLNTLNLKFLSADYSILIHGMLPYLSHLSHLQLGFHRTYKVPYIQHYTSKLNLNFLELLQSYCPQLISLQCVLHGYSTHENRLHELNLPDTSSISRTGTVLEEWKTSIQPWTTLKKISVSCQYTALAMQYFLLYLSVKCKQLESLTILNENNVHKNAQRTIVLNEKCKKIFTFPFIKVIHLVNVPLRETEYAILFGFNKNDHLLNSTNTTAASSSSPLLSSLLPPTTMARRPFENITLINCTERQYGITAFAFFLNHFLFFQETLSKLEISDLNMPIHTILSHIDTRQSNSITHLTLSSPVGQQSMISFYSILTCFRRLLFLKLQRVSLTTGPPVPYIKLMDGSQLFNTHLPLRHLHLENIHSAEPKIFEEISYLCRRLDTLYMKDVTFIDAYPSPPDKTPIHDVLHMIHHDKNDKQKYQQCFSLLNTFQKESNKISTWLELPWTTLKSCTIIGPIARSGARHHSSPCWYLVQQSSLPEKIHYHTFYQQTPEFKQLINMKYKKRKEYKDTYHLYWYNYKDRFCTMTEYDQYTTFQILKEVINNNNNNDNNNKSSSNSNNHNDKEEKVSILSKDRLSSFKKAGLIILECKKLLSPIQFLPNDHY